MVLERVKDKGPSVRKKAVKILGKLCEKGHPHQNVILEELVKRINDEAEGVKQSVLQTFQTLWLNPEMDLKLTAKQMITIVQNSQTEIWLQQLLNAFINEQKEIDEHILQKKIEKLIEIVIGKLVKCIDLQKSVYIMQTLLAFTKLKPKLVYPFVRTITPLLKPDLNNTDEAPQLISICQIMELVCPFMQKTDKLVPEIIQDLRNLIYTQGTLVLNAALKTLVCFVVQVTQDFDILFTLLTKCFLLLKTQMMAKIEKSKLGSIFRALYMLGYLAKLHDFENMQYQEQPFLLDGKTVSVALFDTYEFYCNASTDMIRERALEGLSFLWVRYPILLFKSEHLLKGSLQKCLTTSSKLNILDMLTEFLKSHDKQITKNSSEQRETEQDEGSILGVMQIYLKEVLNLGLDEALELISTLIALQCDKDQYVKDSSYHIIEKIYAKTSEIILVHLIEGLRLAQSFTMRVYNQFPEESVFTRLYNLLKQRKQTRNKFIITVVQQLDPMKPVDPQVFEFLSAVLANCQLQVNEELQLITSYLSQKIDAQTAIFKQKLKQLIKNEDQEKVFEEVQEASLICILLTLRKYLFMLYSYGGYDAETKTYPSDKQLIKNHELQQSFISLCENIQQYYHKQTLQDKEIVELKDIIKGLGKIDIEQIQVFVSKVKRPRRGENLSGKKGANPQKKQETQQKKNEMERLNNQESNENNLVITEQIQQKQKGKITKQSQPQKQVQVKDKEKEKQSQNKSQKNDKQQGVKNSAEEVIVLE